MGQVSYGIFEGASRGGGLLSWRIKILLSQVERSIFAALFRNYPDNADAVFSKNMMLFCTCGFYAALMQLQKKRCSCYWFDFSNIETSCKKINFR